MSLRYLYTVSKIAVVVGEELYNMSRFISVQPSRTYSKFSNTECAKRTGRRLENLEYVPTVPCPTKALLRTASQPVAPAHRRLSTGCWH